MYYVIYRRVQDGGMWYLARNENEANTIILQIARPEQRHLLCGARPPHVNISMLPLWHVRKIGKKSRRLLHKIDKIHANVDIEHILRSGGDNE